MTQWQRTASTLAAATTTLALLLLLFTGQATHAQDDNTLTTGVIAESELTSRRGEEWTFQVCAGELVTITMQSDEFDPYLEVYNASDDDAPVAEVGSEEGLAAIEGLEIERSGPYIILAAGERRRDRGEYSLTLEMADESANQEPVDGVIAAGGSVTGTLRARRAVTWGFQGCEGQVITAEADSDDFDIYLELYPNGADDILVEDDNSGRLTDAAIQEFTLPKTGSYILLVSGATRRDAGDFTLNLSIMDDEDETQAKASTSTPIPTRAKITVRITPRPAATPAPSASSSSSSSSTSSTPAPAESTTAGVINAPQLIAPPDMAAISFGQILFQWRWSGTLAENQGFEVRGWLPGGPHNGIHDARITKGITPDGSGVYSLSRRIPKEFRGKTWQWTVAVVQLDPYKRIGPEAAAYTIVPAKAGGGGGQPDSPLDQPDSPLSRP